MIVSEHKRWVVGLKVILVLQQDNESMSQSTQLSSNEFLYCDGVHLIHLFLATAGEVFRVRVSVRPGDDGFATEDS